METLLSQMVSMVAEICPNADLLQARMKIASVLAAYDIRPAKITAGHPDTSEKVKLFIAAKRLEGLSSHTLTGYGIELRTFGRFVQKPVADITTTDIRSFLGQYEHLKLSTLSRKISVLKSFFSWLADEELLAKDPARKIKPPKPEKRLPKALDLEDLEMIRESCRTLRERALVEVFYATGCRLGEIQTLNRQDIDWQEKSCRVFGKGGKEREVFFSWKAIYHLKKYLKNRNDAHPALFVTERRPIQRLSRRGIQREIRIIAERAGVQKRVHPHVYRHTFATLTLNNGADLVVVQSLLGHSNPATTQVYAQLTSGRRKEQYRKYLVQ